MVQGNWFKANAGDSIVVVNEKGMEYIAPGDEPNVIGVIEDMSTQFNQPQKPIKFKIEKNTHYNYLCVRILEVDIRRTIDYLSAFFDGSSISILNKRFEAWLKYQDRLNTLSNFLAIVSGLLSCCAIYGLSVSLVRDKLKQIAVHKICGANSLNITLFLAREFVRSTLISIAIFAPITYIFVSEMLRNFVYSTHFHWQDPVIPLVYCVLLTIIICAIQAVSLRRADLTSALK